MPMLPKSIKKPRRAFFKPSRPSWYTPYNESPWRRFRASQLSKHPLCAGCLYSGKVVGATVVDHVFPWRGDEERFWLNRFQSLCTFCHNKKTKSELSDHFIFWQGQQMHILRPENYWQWVGKGVT